MEHYVDQTDYPADAPNGVPPSLSQTRTEPADHFMKGYWEEITNPWEKRNLMEHYIDQVEYPADSPSGYKVSAAQRRAYQQMAQARDWDDSSLKYMGSVKDYQEDVPNGYYEGLFEFDKAGTTAVSDEQRDKDMRDIVSRAKKIQNETYHGLEGNFAQQSEKPAWTSDQLKHMGDVGTFH